MEIRVAGDGQLKALPLRGQFRGHEAAGAFRKQAQELIQAGSLWLVVDLMLKLVRPGDQAGHSLQLVGLLSIFEVFDSLPRALASFREGS